MTSHEDHDFGGPRDQCPYCRADLEAENARLQERVEEAERQLLDQVAGNLGEYMEVVQRGCEVWNYMEMMLLPRMEGLAESLQASYEHTAELRALAERRKKALADWPNDGHSDMCSFLHDLRSSMAVYRDCDCGFQARELARDAIEEKP